MKIVLRTPFFFAITLIVLFGCKETPKKVYQPKKGGPNLALFKGKWQGVTQSGNGSFKTESGFLGQVNPNGKLVAQTNVLFFKPLHPDGSIDEKGWVSKLYLSGSRVSYLTNDYPISKWTQIDSLSFKWFLLGKQFRDDRIGNYKDYATFQRKKDSLFITTGRMVLKDSSFQISYHSKYRSVQ